MTTNIGIEVPLPSLDQKLYYSHDGRLIYTSDYHCVRVTDTFYGIQEIFRNLPTDLLLGVTAAKVLDYEHVLILTELPGRRELHVLRFDLEQRRQNRRAASSSSSANTSSDATIRQPDDVQLLCTLKVHDPDSYKMKIVGDYPRFGLVAFSSAQFLWPQLFCGQFEVTLSGQILVNGESPQAMTLTRMPYQDRTVRYPMNFHLFGDRVYFVDMPNDVDESCNVWSYDTKEGKLHLETTSDDYYFVSYNSFWARETLYVHRNGKPPKLYDLRTKKWTQLEGLGPLPTQPNGTYEVTPTDLLLLKHERKLYRVPIRSPEPLRILSWLTYRRAHQGRAFPLERFKDLSIGPLFDESLFPRERTATKRKLDTILPRMKPKSRFPPIELVILDD